MTIVTKEVYLNYQINCLCGLVSDNKVPIKGLSESDILCPKCFRTWKVKFLKEEYGNGPIIPGKDVIVLQTNEEINEKAGSQTGEERGP